MDFKTTFKKSLFSITNDNFDQYMNFETIYNGRHSLNSIMNLESKDPHPFSRNFCFDIFEDLT